MTAALSASAGPARCGRGSKPLSDAIGPSTTGWPIGCAHPPNPAIATVINAGTMEPVDIGRIGARMPHRADFTPVGTTEFIGFAKAAEAMARSASEGYEVLD